MRTKITVFSLILLLGIAQRAGRQERFISDFANVGNSHPFDTILIGFTRDSIWPTETQVNFILGNMTSGPHFCETIYPVPKFYTWQKPVYYNILIHPHNNTNNQAFSGIQNDVWVGNKKYLPTSSSYLRIRNCTASSLCIPSSLYVITKGISRHFIIPIFVRGPPGECPLNKGGH